MRETRTYHKSSWTTVVAALVVIALAIGGVYWWQSRQNQQTQASSIDPNAASHLSEGLKSIEAQDQAFKDVQEVKLLVDTAFGKEFTVIRPLEQLSVEDQAKSKQTLEGGTATTLEAYGLAKKDGEGDTARSLYSSGYFTYKLAGGLVQKSTEAVVKAKAAAEIAGFNQGNNNPDSPYIYANGSVQPAGEVTIKTTGDEIIKLPLSKYEQTIKSKANPSAQKKIVRVLGAAKLGDRLLLVTMAVDDAESFDKEAANLQTMADHVKLEIIK